MGCQYFTIDSGLAIDVEVFTDSVAGQGLGFVAVYGLKWTQGIWPEKWHLEGITRYICASFGKPFQFWLVWLSGFPV